MVVTFLPFFGLNNNLIVEPLKFFNLMKVKSYLLCLCEICLVMACTKSETEDLKEPSAQLTIQLGLNIGVEDIGARLKATNTDDFTVLIFDDQDQLVLSFAHASEITDPVSLVPGSYYVVAHSGNNTPAGFENPYFYGETAIFILDKEESKTVTVNCAIANCKITVAYSAQTLSDFNTCVTTISTTGGSLVFDRDEIRAGYFRTQTLTIEALLSYHQPDGSTITKTLNGSIDNPQSAKHYIIQIDASVADGECIIEITADESMDTEIIVLEDGGSSPPAGQIQYGDLIITEIMANPDSLADNIGEWFEIYNTTPDSICLYHLVCTRGTTNTHIIADSVFIEPYAFFLLSKTTEASSNSVYTYGSAISLTNGGDLLQISTHGTDGTNGNEICSVNYGDPGFPSGTGAALNLDPNNFEVEAAKLATSWCLASVPYNTEDLGTPGLPNTNCQ